MARQVTIPITDHNTGDVCTGFYGIRIKLSSDANWTVLPNQYGTQTGSPLIWAVILDNLVDDVDYDYEITRHCCEGTNSLAASGTFNTTPT